MSQGKDDQLPPSERESRFHRKRFGSPEKDEFQIFIKRDIINKIKLQTACQYNKPGFLLGGHHLQSKTPCIKISKHLAVKNRFSSNSWLKLEEEISLHPDLSLVGWYHCERNAKKRLSQYEKHFHHMHFSEPWQVAMILGYYGGRAVFFGWRSCKVAKFNGYFICCDEKECRTVSSKTKGEINTLPGKDSSLVWPGNQDTLKIFIEDEVLEEIFQYTGWHWRHESGGILLGEYKPDKNILDISKQIPAKNTKAGWTHLTFTHETWNKINEEMGKYPDWIVLGWYHSHPGFATFLSRDDIFIHTEFFNKPYQVALVVDPYSERFDFFGWKGDQIIKFNSHIVELK
jgi:proteasome lid subunit RPN8/RPN11